MRSRATGTRHGWPQAPRTAEAWIALPEIPSGRHLLADVGWVSSARERAVAAGIAELPAPRDIDRGFVSLPAVTVIGADAKLRMFRLPIRYASVVRRFALAEQEIPGPPATRLPCHFVVGDRETVHLVPDDHTKHRGSLN